MATANANGIQIEYETFGAPSNPALLLIIGLGGQLIHWHEDFCRSIADQGYYVIRFDNRDTGLSTKFDEAGVPDITETLNSLLSGEGVTPPYTIEDMSNDAVGLLDALDIQKAHICGMSMGGMIAQTIALKHSSRMLSLISIYSTTGDPELHQPTQEAMEILISPLPNAREAYINQTINGFRVIAGSGLPFDEEYHKRIVTYSTDRSFYPQGIARQLVAVLTQANRKPELSSVTVPTFVIHGDEDPLVPLEAGQDTAGAIPGAELLVIKGMGHELPKMDKNWSKILDAMINHMRKVKS